ncbi:MAG: RIP metalloprotease RseP [Bacteroidetes bacterium]|nr:RIP metalloprotease RseP [Bacteroidota bacterium]
MQEVIYFIITIAVLVFVHELGHFLAAKMTGMRTEAFAIGFGRRVVGWSKNRGLSFGALPEDLDLEGYTDYRLCWLPLGGYVKISGMVDESLDAEYAQTEPKSYEFRSKSAPAKIFVILGGILMNILLAVVIFWGMNISMGKQLVEVRGLNYIPKESLAEKHGFQKGDLITAINNNKIKYLHEISEQVLIHNAGRDITVEFERNGEKKTVTIPKQNVPKDESKGPLFPILDKTEPFVDNTDASTPAGKAGIKPKDKILALNSEPVNSVTQVIDIISHSKGKPVDFTILRGKDTLAIAVTPKQDEAGAWKAGIALGGKSDTTMFTSYNYGFFEAGGKSIEQIGSVTVLTFSMLGKVISGDVAFGKAFGGPVKIAQIAADSADKGMSGFLYFIAMLSLSLAIFNLFPIPVLDGGHLVFIIIESIIKREIPLKIKLRIMNTGMALLIGLMAFVIYNDIFGK